MVQEWMLWALVVALLGIFVALFTLAGREDIRRRRKADEIRDVWVRQADVTTGAYEAWLLRQDISTWPYEPEAGYDVDERKEGANQ